MKRKYTAIKTMPSTKTPDVILTMTDTGEKQEKNILILINAPFKKLDIFTLKDLIEADFELKKNGNHPATKRINKNKEIAFNQYFINGSYIEDVANTLDMPDLIEEAGYKNAKDVEPINKLPIEVRNTLISGVLKVILLRPDKAKYHHIEVTIKGTNTILFTKTKYKSTSKVDGFTPGVVYLIRACGVDCDDVEMAWTDYFEIRAN